MIKNRQPLVLAIHGVGNPIQGQICKDIKTTLRKIGLSTAACTEVNWNSIVEQPIGNGRLRQIAVRNLGNAHAAASLGGTSLQSRNKSLPFLGKFIQLSFVCAELAEFSIFACFAVIAPIVS